MKYPNRVIKQGEKDSAIVTAVQKRLMELGTDSFTSFGIYGPRTVSAVKLFQSTHRDQNGNPLEIDGKLGSISWAALFDIKDVPVVSDATKDLLTEAVTVARSQIGVMENPPGSNKGPEVNDYLRCVDCPPGSFWCAGFVFWCFDKAAKNLGKKNPLVKTGGCLAHWNNTKGKKIGSKTAIENPSLVRPGQIFILDHGSGKGHTGIIEKVEGGFIHTIEGNSNTGGSRNGIGVFPLTRKIAKVNKGFIEY
jgi:hypothetical protein